mmetsp:Transcript_7328/g.19692  ORF Transcript_7328/g.19692 Transcript_7328/m.19692 type:complete len:198 (+) Transcript_7328:514-1107(+)
MCQWALSGSMHKHTLSSLRHVFNSAGMVKMEPASNIVVDYLDWRQRDNLVKAAEHIDGPGWSWRGGGGRRSGTLMGGCVETMLGLMASRSNLPDLQDKVLFLETSEEMPSEHAVYGLLQAMGVTGDLQKVSCLIMGIPKTAFLGQRAPDDYASKQQGAVMRAVHEFAPRARCGLRPQHWPHRSPDHRAHRLPVHRGL